MSTKTSADYTASFRCAFDKKTGDLYIADGFRKRIEFPDQRLYIVDRIKDERNTEHGIEESLHGQAFVQELRREHRLAGRAFRGIRAKGDKFTRALAWANRAEAGKVIFLRGLWFNDFLEEACLFPPRPPRRPDRLRQPRRPDDRVAADGCVRVLKALTPYNPSFV